MNQNSSQSCEERVFINGKEMVRNIDYSINFATGVITALSEAMRRSAFTVEAFNRELLSTKKAKKMPAQWKQELRKFH